MYIFDTRDVIVDYFSIIPLQYGFLAVEFGLKHVGFWVEVFRVRINFYKLVQTEWIFNFQIRVEYNPFRHRILWS